MSLLFPFLAVLAWAGYLDSLLGWHTHGYFNGMHRVERARAVVFAVAGLIAWVLALTIVGVVSRIA
ncbi:hypothetical protein B0T16DRAFT_401273 [Cercophora newfieldiana]|uniref:Uncharacterized protein n=1 Tax=Cercophora newfieldiana TaxID=92897 RepID=A0AA39YRE6_9PEZI|nr:hypothetical protein B0T16DRAFT_401273 [Cercophora newfieldiana]